VVVVVGEVLRLLGVRNEVMRQIVTHDFADTPSKSHMDSDLLPSTRLSSVSISLSKGTQPSIFNYQSKNHEREVAICLNVKNSYYVNKVFFMAMLELYSRSV
jgi:hypothetical protein